MPMTVTHQLTVCECCAVMIANADGCHCPVMNHPDGLAAFIDLPEGIDVVTEADEECAFDWTQCDGCGTTLAGARYGAAGLSPIQH